MSVRTSTQIDAAVGAAAARGGGLRQIGLVVLGIMLGQFVLYGSSLLGRKVLLPLDWLAEPSVYNATNVTDGSRATGDYYTTDLIFYQEPERQFVIHELRAGRLPLWSPYRFGGAPCWPLGLAPAWWPAYLIASPVVLAWTQMLVALIAGTGAYLFFRRSLHIRYWPATIGAWCYPLTAAFVIWQGFWLPAVFCWLPWFFLCVDAAVRGPRGWGAPGLAILTFFALIGGAEDIAGQVLLASGIYGIWSILDHHRFRIRERFLPMLRSAVVLALGWSLGIGLSAWIVFPLYQYTSTGARLIDRGNGREERPPGGLWTLPELLVPQVYGSAQLGSFRIAPGDLQESASPGFVGIIAALFLAPLAFLRRSRRSIGTLLVILIFITMSWSLNIPGMLWLLRRPLMNMMSHNRFVFVSGFAILTLSVVGLENLMYLRERPRWWMLAPLVALLGLAVWSGLSAVRLPEPIRSQLGEAIQRGESYSNVRTLQDVRNVQSTFRRDFAVAAISAGAGIAAGILYSFHRRKRRARWFPAAVAVCMVLELLLFGYPIPVQSDPSLYFPRVDFLEQIARMTPGRIVGINCLPANLSQMVPLADIRGYDGVDPKPMMDLLTRVAGPQAIMFDHARTQWWSPSVLPQADGSCRLPPVLDMLGVRYVIYRGSPFAGVTPMLQSGSYWALENRLAMPRVFVPLRVETISDSDERIRRLTQLDFDPRAVAFVEQPLNMPSLCAGEAKILDEVPRRVTVALNMQTDGLVVLADAFDEGWRAYVDSTPTPILRTNHAVRGVVVPAGASTLQFRYEPRSFYHGLALCALAALAWAGWVLWTFVERRLRRFQTDSPGHARG
jgi:hypothetical protein